MAVGVFGAKLKCRVSAKRMWRAAFEDGINCLPKAVPQAIASVEHDGNGFQPGSERTIHFHKSHAEHIAALHGHPEHLVLLIKEKLLEVDHEALKLKAEVLEGGFLDILVKRYTFTVQIKEGEHPIACKATTEGEHPVTCTTAEEGKHPVTCTTAEEGKHPGTCTTAEEGKHPVTCTTAEVGKHPGTCVVHWSFEYEAISEKHQAYVPAALKDAVPKSFMGLEAYLLTHDDYLA